MENIELALTEGRGIISRRVHPELARALARGAQAGRLARLGPGLYTAAGLAHDPAVLARAAMAWAPDGVIRGAAAAALTWWPGLKIESLLASDKVSHRGGHGLSWSREVLPADLVLEADGLRLACPAVSVLDLVPRLGGAVIDEALRRRAVSLTALHETLARLPDRSGNVERRWLLRDSRDEPWSEAERHLHRGVRSLRLAHPYRTNYRLALPAEVVFLDLALPRLSLCFEVDGFEFHGGRDAFERDRRRIALVAAEGWQCIPFSAHAVLYQTTWVLHMIEEAVRRRAALMRAVGPRPTT